jgi:threonine/homoserine/homoserine lactone efflux protein
MSAYACAAGAGGGRMRSAPRFNWMNRLAGGMMVGLGVAVAAR